MKKRMLPALLALLMALTLLPAASAADAHPPDWYFLFAIFKNIDADYTENGTKKHTKYTMTQDEVEVIRDNAREFEEYLTQTGVMRAHVEVVEVDGTVTQLKEGEHGQYLAPELAAPLLKDKVDLDRYDHITCAVSLNFRTSYLGLGGSSFENGSGFACVNHVNREYCTSVLSREKSVWNAAVYVHELLHFMENMNLKWGEKFGLHDIRINYYMPDGDEGKACYQDIILNRAQGEAGTGVAPAAWEYPPHVLRTMREMTVPSGVTSIGEWAFNGSAALTRLNIPSSVTKIGYSAFGECTALTDILLFSGVTSMEDWAFGECTSLTHASIPDSLTSIGYAAFYNTGLQEVYYGGTEEQWNAIRIDEYNGELTGADIYYNSLLADVKTSDFYAGPVAWAMERGIAGGTGGGRFSPGDTCSQAQILTFLWRAGGEPEPEGAVKGSEYYAAAVQWAGEQGLIDGGFEPDAPCTRAAVVSYLWRLAGSPAAGSAGFSDVPAGADYAGAVAWAVRQGVTNGSGDGTFSPDDACTRGEIVTFLYRAMGA